MGTKLLKELKEHIDKVFGPPTLDFWYRIYTLDRKVYHIVHWKATKGNSENVTQYRWRSVTRITYQELPIDITTKERLKCTT